MVVDAYRAILDDESLPIDEQWIFLVDLEDGFNQGVRGKRLKRVWTQSFQLYPRAISCYGRHSFLSFGDKRLTSKAGALCSSPSFCSLS